MQLFLAFNKFNLMSKIFHGLKFNFPGQNINFLMLKVHTYSASNNNQSKNDI